MPGSILLAGNTSKENSLQRTEPKPGTHLCRQLISFLVSPYSIIHPCYIRMLSKMDNSKQGCFLKNLFVFGCSDTYFPFISSPNKPTIHLLLILFSLLILSFGKVWYSTQKFLMPFSLKDLYLGRCLPNLNICSWSLQMLRRCWAKYDAFSQQWY